MKCNTCGKRLLRQSTKIVFEQEEEEFNVCNKCAVIFTCIKKIMSKEE